MLKFSYFPCICILFENYDSLISLYLMLRLFIALLLLLRMLKLWWTQIMVTNVFLSFLSFLIRKEKILYSKLKNDTCDTAGIKAINQI